jgi:hypothetical protein
VRKADGTGVVVDVRPDDRVPARDAETFAVTAQACQAAGWEYRRAGDLDPVMAANVRWLSRYRHRRCLVPGIAGALVEAFAGGQGLFEGAELAGDRLRVLPMFRARGRQPSRCGSCLDHATCSADGSSAY